MAVNTFYLKYANDPISRHSQHFCCSIKLRRWNSCLSLSLLLQKGCENVAYCCIPVGISFSSLIVSPAVFQEDTLLLKMWWWLRYETERSRERLKKWGFFPIFCFCSVGELSPSKHLFFCVQFRQLSCPYIIEE